MEQMEKHKVFTSFYHKEDSHYKELVDGLLANDYINKSVQDGEYDSDNSDEYIKRLIQEDKISDSSVVIVLVGKNTYKRKHVDWEISAALNKKVNGYSGLVGVFLPGHNEYNTTLPARLQDNVESGYAGLCSWEQFVGLYSVIIETAFENRISNANKIDNSRPQMKNNIL